MPHYCKIQIIELKYLISKKTTLKLVTKRFDSYTFLAGQGSLRAPYWIVLCMVPSMKSVGEMASETWPICLEKFDLKIFLRVKKQQLLWYALQQSKTVMSVNVAANLMAFGKSIISSLFPKWER